MGKTTLLVGFAAGYVLGSRAGRERYESIASAARKMRQSPAVQDATDAVGAQVTDLRESAKEKVSEGVQAGVAAATAKVKETTGQPASDDDETSVTAARANGFPGV